MLKKLKEILANKGSRQKPNELASLESDKLGNSITPDLILTIAVVLIYVASVDEDVSKEEAEEICSVMEFNLGVPQEEIPEIVKKALILRRSKEKIDDFIFAINAQYNNAQRVRVLGMVWKLAFADKKLEKSEEKGVVKIASLMQLSLEDQQVARVLAEEGKV